MIDLKTYNFPVLTAVDLAFSTLDTPKELVDEAYKRGFNNFHNPYNKLFSKLFFEGGKVVFKEDVDAEYKQNVWSYCRALMGSFTPKHQHKEAVCAMLMSEVIELETTNIPS
jgi:hypothetical protein